MSGPSQTIRELCPIATINNDGIMSASQAAALNALGPPGSIPVFSNATRPSGGSQPPAGRIIFNTDDLTLNVSDGTDWRDMDGTVT
jgi:hypothetical protein